MSYALYTSMDTGYRDEGEDGKVIHFRFGASTACKTKFQFGASIACKTKGENRQASSNPRDVNCLKCLAIIKKILR
jgi:hypothetical protein